MTEYLPAIIIGCLVLSGSSIIAIVAFWMRLGGDITKGREAHTAVKTLEQKLADYRVEAAEKFATSHDLAEAEGRTAHAIESLRQELRTMNDRLLQAITARPVA